MMSVTKYRERRRPACNERAARKQKMQAGRLRSQ